MNILVTGGAGFLGSHLSERFVERDCDVYVLDNIPRSKDWKIEHLLARKNFHFSRGSILDGDLMDSLVKKCDTIFHFAAVVGVEHYVARPYDVLDVNVNGTKLVLDLAYKYGKKVVFASTSEIYGKNAKVPFKEDDDRVLGSTRIDRWCYSSSKAVGEHFCFAYYQKGLKVVVLRFFNAYGPKLDSIDAGRVISIFMGQLLRGEPLTVIGDGKQTRCFTYVDDIVDGIIASSEKEKAVGMIFNLGTDVETSMLELAQTMVRISGRDNQIRFIKSEGKYGLSYEDIRRRVPDITNAKTILGFNPKVNLEEGLSRTIAWFKEYYGDLKTAPAPAKKAVEKTL